MLRSFKKANKLAVEFCERCACVCDAGCRAAAIRERALVQALQSGLRL